jgi:hypothetical protein
MVLCNSSARFVEKRINTPTRYDVREKNHECFITKSERVRKIDRIGLHVSSILGWMLLPELVGLLEQHVEQCTTEMLMQVHFRLTDHC